VTSAASHSASPPAAAELRRGSSSVRVAIAAGAPIVSCCIDGREWCSAGAWQDYAPTSGACTLPTFVTGAPRGAFPEGGLLASEIPAINVRADGGTTSITAEWPAAFYPLSWRREIGLDDSGAMRVKYAVTNSHRSPLPFVWGLRMPMDWSPSLLLELPRASRSRVAASYGSGLPKAGSEFTWPSLRDGGKLIDLTRPSRIDSRSAVLCYVELSRGRFTLRSESAALEVAGDPGLVSHAHIWTNNDTDIGRTAPRRWWRFAPEHTLTVGPSVGAPGVLSDAVGSWNTARWIESGETMQWEIHCRPVAPSPT
jgi:hypothetical protein